MYATLDLGVLLVGVVCCWKRRLAGRDRLGTELHALLGQELAFRSTFLSAFCLEQKVSVNIKGIRVRIVTIVAKP